ncbi:MAG: TIGR02302 family protein [Pseudomonadota bacterium]
MDSPSAVVRHAKKRAVRAVATARLVLFFENLWPRLALALLILVGFLTASWFGFWGLLPDWPRLVVVALFGLAAIASLIWLARTPRPKSSQAVRRVEEASLLTGHPVRTLHDSPLDEAAPARDLWSEHQRRAAASFKTLKVGAPTPSQKPWDSWPVRLAAMALLAWGFFTAGPERPERIMAAFAPPSLPAVTPVRVDVWATPPTYTGLPPQTLLSGLEMTGSADPQDLTRVDGVSVPTGTRLTVLASPGGELLAELVSGGETIVSVQGDSDGQGPMSFETEITSRSELILTLGRNQTVLDLNATPDQPPSIAFVERPQRNPSGGLDISYSVDDDYGVTSATAEFVAIKADQSALEPLFDAPMLSLVLPRTGDSGSLRTTRDLSAHPWAGQSVMISLIATDGAGQNGRSEPIELTIPTRPFSDPLALALVEQRGSLAINRDHRFTVLTALEGLALSPEEFMQDQFAAFLGLNTVTQRLRSAASDDDLREVVGLLWDLALNIEDGDLSVAAERLREAEQALSDALERGASEEEIAELMDELRQALENYMQALAQEMQQQGAEAPNQQAQNTQQLDQQTMQSLMDQIEELSQLGASEAAREMLDELRRQLEALRNAQPGEAPEPSEEQQALMDALQDLQSITREQQSLLDDTFPFSSDAQRPQVQNPFPFGLPNQPNRARPLPRSENGQNAPNGPNDQNENRENPLQDLAERQQQLQQQLQDLLQQLEELGLDPGQLGDAEQSMGGAGQMLDRGSASSALPQQGEALQALRQGAQNLAQQLQGEGQAQGQGQGQGTGQAQGRPRLLMGPGQNDSGVDPLGRPQRSQGIDRGDRVRIPEESDLQRARQILDEIQRRLGDQQRPRLELDYLDRLIDRF